jgi:hypothetical protein
MKVFFKLFFLKKKIKKIKKIKKNLKKKLKIDKN